MGISLGSSIAENLWLDGRHGITRNKVREVVLGTEHG